MKKVIFILSDALRYDVALANMGFLGHLVETRQASLFKIIGELPGMSRPMYETIHTGLPATQHGVVSNSIVRRSQYPNIFQAVRDAGGVTAAAAYSWFSELYNRAPYDSIEDREVDDGQLLIQHGRFYSHDDYPDSELFYTAANLVRRFSPHYLLLHPMGMDYKGETFGAETSQYRSQAVYQDTKLAPLIMEWRDRGYFIIISGDHGINADGNHGGATADQRDVPFYAIPPHKKGDGNTGEIVSHLQIAPTILQEIGVSIPATMKHPPISLSVA